MAGVGVSASSPGGGRSTVVPIVALDYPDSDSALALVSQLGESCRFYKIGSELFTAAGPSIVEAVRRTGCDVFLDLKLHDIPNTVAGATGRIREMGVRLTTVHASGGRPMIEAAVEAAGPECGILAVTVLTSLDSGSLGEVIGAESADVIKSVIRLAALAAASGARGVVCSGDEARQVRAHFGPNLEVLVPGVRLPGDAAGDQSRIVTPEAAAAAGADYVVLGRTITAAADPGAAMRSVLDRLAVGNTG
jgi:orotidine-5'-phosphate decarboxylase